MHNFLNTEKCKDDPHKIYSMELFYGFNSI